MLAWVQIPLLTLLFSCAFFSFFLHVLLLLRQHSHRHVLRERAMFLRPRHASSPYSLISRTILSSLFLPELKLMANAIVLIVKAERSIAAARSKHRAVLDVSLRRPALLSRGPKASRGVQDYCCTFLFRSIAVGSFFFLFAKNICTKRKQARRNEERTRTEEKENRTKLKKMK